MGSRLHAAVSIALFLWSLPATGAAAPVQDTAYRIDTALAHKISSTSGSEILDITLRMEDQAKISSLLESLQSRGASAAERHAAVIAVLQGAALAAQPPVLEELGKLQQSGLVNSFKGFWISNIIEARVRADAVVGIAGMDGVEVVYLTPRAVPVEVMTGRAPQAGASEAGAAQDEQAQAAFGPRMIKADSLWMLGITGAGRVVGHIDYGVDGTRPALAGRWRGNFAPPEECWLAPGTSFPFDSSGHGTLTMGILAGRDSSTGDTTGVAIDALWISARIGLDVHSVNATEALQWMADPDGDPGTFDDVPDVVSNSWVYKPETECYHMDWDVIDNVEAAGVCVIFAAGNAGPAWQTVASPGSRNTSDTKGFSVGAVDNAGLITDFSGRGPSPCDGVTKKPEVSTPGTGCRTTLMGGGYINSSGTSIACPFAAGAVALLRQINPETTAEDIQYALLLGARDTGATGDDNVYGMGIADIYAAAGFVSPYRVTGSVTDTDTGQPIARAAVHVMETGQCALTDLSGQYEIGALLREVHLITGKFGYYPDTSSVLSLGGPALTYNVELSGLEMGSLTGAVTDSSSGEGVQAAVILLSNGEPVDTAFTDPGTGVYVFESVPVSSPPLTDYTGVECRFLMPYPTSAVYPHSIVIEHGGTTVLDVLVSPARVLIADDDGGADYEKYFISAVDTAGWTCYHHDVHETGESVVYVIDEFPPGTILVWFTGAKEETLSPQEQDSLRAFLGRGGRLFITGQNIAEDLTAQGSDFLARWLHAGYGGNTTLQYAEGFAGDPVFDGMLMRTMGSGGADDQYSRDVLSPDGVSSPACSYTETGGGGSDSVVAGLLVDDSPGSGSRIVYLGFGFEAVNRPSPSDSLYAARSELMERILEWLEGPVGIGGGDGGTGTESVPRVYALSQNYPNPFNPVTTISFDIPDNGRKPNETRLTIFDIRGRVIRTMLEGSYPPGRHEAVWNGRDDSGRTVSSGVYMYRLTVDRQTITRKMLLLK